MSQGFKVAAALLLAASLAAPAFAQGDAAALYKIKCAMCHGAKGDGKGELAEEMKISPPALTISETILAIRLSCASVQPGLKYSL